MHTETPLIQQVKDVKYKMVKNNTLQSIVLHWDFVVSTLKLIVHENPTAPWS